MFVKAVSFELDLMGLFFIDAPVIFGAAVGGQSAVTTAVFIVVTAQAAAPERKIQE